MEYSKSNSNSNNRKELKITTGVNVCRVNTYNYENAFKGLDDEPRKQEEKKIATAKKSLLITTKHAVNIISNRSCSYIEASKPKTKKFIFYKSHL